MTEGAEVPRPGGGGWKLALRILVTVTFLAVLASRAKGVEDVVPDEHHMLTAVLLVSAVVATLIGVVLSAWRWQRVLEVFDAHIVLRTLTTIYLASLCSSGRSCRRRSAAMYCAFRGRRMSWVRRRRSAPWQSNG